MTAPLPRIGHAITTLGGMADDFMLTILELKARDSANQTLPFLHGHALELSAKCAILQLEQSLDPDKLGHKIQKIYAKIAVCCPEFGCLLPKPNSYARYRSIWVRDGIPNQIIELPPPDLLDEYELCFFIENIVNLKYGLDKNMELLSPIHISHKSINSKFLNLFAGTRKIYATPDLNQRAMNRGEALFGSNQATASRLHAYFGVNS